MATQLQDLQMQHEASAEAHAEALQAVGDVARAAQIAQAGSLQSVQTSLFKCAPQRALDFIV